MNLLSADMDDHLRTAGSVKNVRSVSQVKQYLINDYDDNDTDLRSTEVEYTGPH